MQPRDLPTSPGVYIFAAQDKVIYVGKAKNLKNRISSYLLTYNQTGKTKSLVDSAKSIAWVQVDSELQAIILEAHCIKLLAPKFNLRSKDDKSPLYIIITREKFPRVLTSRNPRIRNSKLEIRNWYGPFSSSTQAHKLLYHLRHAFPFCNATALQKQHRQSCFYVHVGLCSGACIGQVSSQSYQGMIRRLIHLLSGEQSKVVAQMTRSMKRFSHEKKYEAAAQIRDQLSTLSHLNHVMSDKHFTDEVTRETHQQKALIELQQILNLTRLPSRIECYDVANIQGKFATAAMVVANSGLQNTQEYRHFKIRTLSSPNDPLMISEVINRRLKHDKWPQPDLIVVDGGITQLTATKRVTNLPVIGLAKREETIVTPTGEIHLSRYSPALQLLQALRDEAHRFSRRLHHQLHQKQMLK